MAVAKNPGVGQGRGGGRPKGKASERGEERPVKPVQLRLSPRAVELIQAAAVVGKVRPWVVVERAILAMHDGPQGRDSTVISNDTLPHEALEIARECAAFLEAQEDRAAALKVLRRAWKQALALTRLELRADP